MKNTNQTPVTLPQYEGLSKDMLEKLTGQNAQYWLWVYNRVSRGQNPFEIPEDETERWRLFYLKFFGLETDFSNTYIPERHTGFFTTLFFPKGLTFDTVISVYRRHVRTEKGERFSFHTSTPQKEQESTFENSLIDDVRTSKNASYAIRISDLTWQSRFDGSKVVDLENDGIKFLNPREYFIYDLYWMWTTGKGPIAAPDELDSGTAILCGCKMQYKDHLPVYPSVHWDYHPNSYFRWDQIPNNQFPSKEMKLGFNKDNSRSNKEPIVIEIII